MHRPKKKDLGQARKVVDQYALHMCYSDYQFVCALLSFTNLSIINYQFTNPYLSKTHEPALKS